MCIRTRHRSFFFAPASLLVNVRLLLLLYRTQTGQAETYTWVALLTFPPYSPLSPKNNGARKKGVGRRKTKTRRRHCTFTHMNSTQLQPRADKTDTSSSSCVTRDGKTGKGGSLFSPFST